jgi:assimilatory nitrate reductase catalytic subunit
MNQHARSVARHHQFWTMTPIRPGFALHDASALPADAWAFFWAYMPLVMTPAAQGWDEGQKRISTHCSYCALQCALNLTVDLGTNKVVKVRGRRDFPTSKGLSCIKGQTAHLQLDHQDRLTTPLIRDGKDSWRPASWDEALDAIAMGLRQCQERHGRDTAAMFGSGALSNETVYLLGKFARLALKTKNIDYNGRYCMSSAAAAQNAVFGLDRGLHFPLADLQLSRCILLVGANVAECLPPIQTFLRRAKKAGAKLIVAEPRANDTTKIADLHLACRPGSDLALALALLHEIAALKGLDFPYLQSRCKGFTEALEASKACHAQWASGVCGLPAADIRRAAQWMVEAKPSLILTGRGAEQHAKGPETVMAFINVALALGQVGTPGGGFGTLTGQGNGQGGREQGQKADQLVGYRLIENPADREAVAASWGVDPSELPGKGMSAQELFMTKNRGAIRAMWVVASNPAVSAANNKEVRESLQGLDFLAVSDIFFSETCRFAHVILPAAAYAEEDGTMTNIEGRCVLRRAAVRAPGEAKADWKALCGVAARLGQGDKFAFENPERIFEEFCRATRGGRADYSGMNYRKLERNKGLFWPCKDLNDPGKSHLFQESFSHPDGLAHMQATPWRVSSEEPDADYPYRLTTGRVLSHYLTGNQTRRIPSLLEADPRPYVQVSKVLAQRLGLLENASVRLKTRRGSMVLPLKINSSQEEGTLFVPIHFGDEGCVNDLTQDALSPLSKMPEFKNCAATLESL